MISRPGRVLGPTAVRTKVTDNSAPSNSGALAAAFRGIISATDRSAADPLKPDCQPLTPISRKCSAIINLRLPDGKRLIKKPNHFQVRLNAPLPSFAASPPPLPPLWRTGRREEAANDGR